MKCVNPFVKAGEVYPCGQCLPCKFRSRRIWFHRVLLEASQHEHNSVVTLTIAPTEYPSSPLLNAACLRNWLKRYRKHFAKSSGRRCRFIAVGEYGESSQRPHFHVVLFGAPGCLAGRTGKLWCQDCGCETCRRITLTWKYGACSVDTLSASSAAYVAGYVTRKVLAVSLGRTKPFMRMSNRPGIGASAMFDVASTLLQYNLPVPTHLSSGPLGRYLRRKLSEYVQCDAPAQASSKAMQAVRDYAWSHGHSQNAIYRAINEVYASQLSQRELLKKGVL